MNKTGYVQFVDGNKVTVDGEKYSTYPPSTVLTCRPGDYVSFEYVDKPGINKVTGATVIYKNIRGPINVAAPGSAPAPTGMAVPPKGYSPAPYKAPEEVGKPILSKDRLILRQNALTAAVNFVGRMDIGDGPRPTTEDVVAVAKKFEYYTSGDMDVDMAEEALKADSPEC